MAVANTFAFNGIEAVPVEVQVQIAPGSPGLVRARACLYLMQHGRVIVGRTLLDSDHACQHRDVPSFYIFAVRCG
jgi:hypothetical protein